ncbi:hypothetical protein KTE60_25220 [Burkholderia multivorans]|uniref:Secreted protein n=2 Tax=Burkholderia multivorans TaxID=87883 RepID=A0A0H3KRN0_BURM1|nr:hypothetical protein [Burkholderia multivorans]BAG47744.1 hypothetical protein BMULJ_05940 [Burkholderia multivorans ATCC 17616]MBU9203994.1 hypothetical protein [Burkholderia multivorans]MBU9352006.1 hypothetical protein [Burkholderia multivorans]MBU9395711.1 hypothetical protein [Burkholderia multivorans]
MKRWIKRVVAVLQSVAVGAAFADGSCQSGFTLRSYPFYDKTGAYIGMRQACAPIPCTSGYQDSTCAAPLRNGAIPQPQCQTGAGWVTVSSAVWQGSRWSDPQCSYSAQPQCPAGFDTSVPSSWTGSGWTQPECVKFTPPPPVVIDPDVACTAAASSHKLSAFDMQVFNSIEQTLTRDAPFQQKTQWRDWSTLPGVNPDWPYGIAGYKGDKVFTGTWTGPWYNKQLACTQQNSWATYCYVNPSNGAVDFLWVNTAGAGNGQCNH